MTPAAPVPTTARASSARTRRSAPPTVPSPRRRTAPRGRRASRRPRLRHVHPGLAGQPERHRRPWCRQAGLLRRSTTIKVDPDGTGATCSSPTVRRSASTTRWRRPLRSPQQRRRGGWTRTAPPRCSGLGEASPQSPSRDDLPLPGDQATDPRDGETWSARPGPEGTLRTRRRRAHPTPSPAAARTAGCLPPSGRADLQPGPDRPRSARRQHRGRPTPDTRGATVEQGSSPVANRTSDAVRSMATARVSSARFTTTRREPPVHHQPAGGVVVLDVHATQVGVGQLGWRRRRGQQLGVHPQQAGVLRAVELGPVERRAGERLSGSWGRAPPRRPSRARRTRRCRPSAVAFPSSGSGGW